MQLSKPHRRLKRCSVSKLESVNSIQAGIFAAVGMVASAEASFYLIFLAKFVWHII